MADNTGLRIDVGDFDKVSVSFSVSGYFML